MKNLKIALPLLCLASAAWAAEAVTKEVTGEAAILNNDKVKATEDAKKAALREAVEQVAGTLISASTITSNSQLISDRVFSHASGYVKSYSVVGKPVEESGVMKVTVKAEVSTAQLDQDLLAVQALIKRLENRKLVIITQEQSVDVKGTVQSSEHIAQVLTEAFKKDGWTIIDPHFAAGKLKLGGAIGAAEVKEIGDLTKADFILYGTASYRYQPPNGGIGADAMFLISGEYDLTLFATDSGTQVTKVAGKFNTDAKKLSKVNGSYIISYERTAFDVTKAESADIVSQVRSKSIEYFQSNEQNGNRVVMNVVGLSEYAAVQNFKKMLQESIAGVRDVRAGNFAGGKAQFDLSFVGTTDDLASKVGGKTFKSRKISVTGVTGNTLELTLAK